jgi:hypothetical protein
LHDRLVASPSLAAPAIPTRTVVGDRVEQVSQPEPAAVAEAVG